MTAPDSERRAPASDGDAWKRAESGPVDAEKRRVVVQVMRLTPESCPRVQGWIGLDHSREEHMCHQGMMVPTREGDLFAHVGAYIVRGVEGEFYPVDPGIFLKTYRSPQTPRVKTTVPGIRAEMVTITEACRDNRGNDGAIDEAMRRIYNRFIDMVEGTWKLGTGATFRLVLALEYPERRKSDSAADSETREIER